MLVVGQKLQEWAKRTRISDDERDAFGRSAFNRYYYASYLTVRAMLVILDNKWGREGHAKIPDLLEKTVVKKIRLEAGRRVKVHLLTRSEAHSLCSTANTAASELSSLLKSSYDIRVTADYKPEVKIVKSGSEISLEGNSLNAAEAWPDRARMLTKTLLKIWRKQLGIC